MATALMIVGDSISGGSAGDYTWRFRLWEHLKGSGVADVAFVGPRRGLDDLSRSQPDADSEDYADPGFDENHLAMWGQPLVEVVGKVGSRVRDFDPDIVLTLLGINDLIWQDRTAIQMEQDAEELGSRGPSAQARRRPRVRAAAAQPQDCQGPFVLRRCRRVQRLSGGIGRGAFAGFFPRGGGRHRRRV